MDALLKVPLPPLLLSPAPSSQVGHAGTLDPLATGLIIICTGKGTKACDSFMAMHKSYSGSLRLGEGTLTYDAEMEVSERLPWEHLTDEDVQKAVKQLTGDLMQVGGWRGGESVSLPSQVNPPL